MAWRYRFDFVEDEDEKFLAEVLQPEAGPLLAAGPELRDALKGLMEIAEQAMPDTFFQTDSRVNAARNALALCEGDSE